MWPIGRVHVYSGMAGGDDRPVERPSQLRTNTALFRDGPKRCEESGVFLARQGRQGFLCGGLNIRFLV